MILDDFSFDLPEELVGQVAIEPRDSCRLLVLSKKNGKVSHNIFRDLVDILDNNYVLVLNDTKVFPARLFGTKDTGGKIELLLLKQLSINSFECIGKGKFGIGQELIFDHGLKAKIISKDEEGILVLDFNQSGQDLLNALDLLGKTPLPPYIHSSIGEKSLREQYQTVYARERGSAAAPTAGLHFTDTLLSNLDKKGVEIEKITLHVGLGTFRPVTDEQIASQTLHSESFNISPETAERLNAAKQMGKKIIAVGTTSCRALESTTDDKGLIKSGEGETNIFIQPGYKFKFVDGLVTNFHLPKTSLLMLVSALVCFPNSPTKFNNFSDSPIGKAYDEAVKEKYKFFSFGDAMLII